MDRGIKASRKMAGGIQTPGSVIEIDGCKVPLTIDMLGMKVLKYRHAEYDPATDRSIVGREMLLSIQQDRIVEIDLSSFAVASAVVRVDDRADDSADVRDDDGADDGADYAPFNAAQFLAETDAFIRAVASAAPTQGEDK
jgi:hypothetical protein